MLIFYSSSIQYSDKGFPHYYYYYYFDIRACHVSWFVCLSLLAEWYPMLV